MTRVSNVSNFRNQSLPQLTLAIRGGHCGLSPGFLEEPIRITFPPRSLAGEAPGQ